RCGARCSDATVCGDAAVRFDSIGCDIVRSRHQRARRRKRGRNVGACPPCVQTRSDGRAARMMDALLADLRYALRTFARSPALVAAAVVCLALGIGANATIFGVVDTLLFRPPPHIEDPAHVVRLYFRRDLAPFGVATSSTTGYPLYRSIRDAVRAFNDLAAFTYAP